MKYPHKAAHRGRLEALHAEGKVSDKAVEAGPELLPQSILFWDAYSDLTRVRSWTEGRPQTICYAELYAYCQMHQFEPELSVELAYYVSRLEDVYFEVWQRKQKRGKGTRSGSQSVGRTRQRG